MLLQDCALGVIEAASNLPCGQPDGAVSSLLSIDCVSNGFEVEDWLLAVNTQNMVEQWKSLLFIYEGRSLFLQMHSLEVSMSTRLREV